MGWEVELGMGTVFILHVSSCPGKLSNLAYRLGFRVEECTVCGGQGDRAESGLLGNKHPETKLGMVGKEVLLHL